MVSENWKILLDFKSQPNVTKRRMRLLFWEVKLFHVRFLTNNISLHFSKLYAYNTSIGKFNLVGLLT